MFVVLAAISVAGECLPIGEAARHVGETACVTGRVFHVKQGNGGAHFFDFCEDYRTCPFTVVVFASRLRDVGDVRQLEGKQIEIHGPIQLYDGRAEIILERAGQLRGEAARIPPLPKGYDVENKGRYSAGTFSRPKARKTAKKRQPARVQTEETVDPMEQ